MPITCNCKQQRHVQQCGAEAHCQRVITPLSETRVLLVMEIATCVHGTCNPDNCKIGGQANGQGTEQETASP